MTFTKSLRSSSMKSIVTAATDVDDSTHSSFGSSIMTLSSAVIGGAPQLEEDTSSLSTEGTAVPDEHHHQDHSDDRKKTTRVRFSTLTIREYARCLGDNPGVRFGAPLSLEWTVQEEFEPIEVDMYEAARGERRTREELVIPASTRAAMMRDSGYSRNEIMECIRQANLAKGRRRRTNETMKLASAEELLQKAVRGIKKVSPGHREQKKLAKQALTDCLARDQEQLQKQEQVRRQSQLEQRLAKSIQVENLRRHSQLKDTMNMVSAHHHLGEVFEC